MPLFIQRGGSRICTGKRGGGRCGGGLLASQLQHALPERFDAHARVGGRQLLGPETNECLYFEMALTLAGHLTLSATLRNSCSSLILTCAQGVNRAGHNEITGMQHISRASSGRSHHRALVSAFEVHRYLHGVIHEALVQAVKLVLEPSWEVRI